MKEKMLNLQKIILLIIIIVLFVIFVIEFFLTNGRTSLNQKCFFLKKILTIAATENFIY